MFAFRHGPWLCAVVFLPVDKYMCRLWGRSDTPMVYIVLASRCIWYRVKWVLFHRPRYEPPQIVRTAQKAPM